ncbi:MAG: ABC transporter ATP-binding protein [Candidatus Dormibacteria bacterium]
MTATGPAATLEATPPRPRFWAQVAGLLRPHRTLLALAVACVVGAAVAGVVPPLVVRDVIDHNLLPGRTSGLLVAGLVYLGAVTASNLLSYCYSYLSAMVAQRTIAEIRVRLFAHLASLPIPFFDRTPLGDIISRATADVETVDTLFTDGIATLVGQLVALIAVAVAMVVISPMLSAVSLIVAPPLLLISRWLQVRVRDAERQTRVAIGGLNTQLSETVGGAETIRAFGRETAFLARFRAGLGRTLVAQASSVRYNAFFTPVTGLLAALVVAALLWIGAGGVLGAAGTDLGTLVAFVLLFQTFFAPITALGDQWNRVQAALAGMERVLEVLNLPPEPAVAEAAAPGPAAGIAVVDVSFGYQTGRSILRRISLAVRPGERVAVVGRTGAGKSTLLALLGGLYQPDTGEILVAGRHPRSLADRERRRTVGTVPQNVQLFSESLRDNLTLGDPSVDDQAIRRALALVGLDPWLAGLTDGLDTRLAGSGGGAGRTLSTGQRQLVALARALVVEPQVLLLDEATAAIDGASDLAFRSALARTAWAGRCAVLTVAHRVSTARGADRVVVLEAGQIVEHGPPEELLAADGHFAALATLDEAGWDPSGIHAGGATDDTW